MGKITPLRFPGYYECFREIGGLTRNLQKPPAYREERVYNSFRNSPVD